MITHIKKLKTQLFKLFEKYQKYFNFLHALHLHFRKTMLRNRFKSLFRRKLKKLKKLFRQFEHIETFFDERKTHDFDLKKVRKINFFYKQSNVNVNKNNSAKCDQSKRIEK